MSFRATRGIWFPTLAGQKQIPHFVRDDKDEFAVPITIKLFAHYRDLLGKSELSIPSRPGITVAEVFAETIGDRANSALRKSTMFAVNESYVSAETKVNDGDRIAFIPPVSGG